MRSDKPTDIDEYIKWLNNEHRVRIENYQRNFGVVSEKVKLDFEKKRFWPKLLKRWTDYGEEYLVSNEGYHLFTSDEKPEIIIKPYGSFIDKTFRKNIVLNDDWPKPPAQTGWILPPNWYSQIHDIIRTRIVVKYLDGVKFIMGKIQGLCSEVGKRYQEHYEAREDGYYAVHMNIYDTFEIPTTKLGTERKTISTEIQITTQLQEAIQKILHRLYEKKRKEKARETKWQWDHQCEEFSINYLGHILHYVEGMIMDIRGRQKEREQP